MPRFAVRPRDGDPRVRRRECKGYFETTAFQGWRLCIARGGKTFTRYFADKRCGGERGALKELTGFLDTAPRKDGKLTSTAEAGARKVLGAG